MTVQSPSPVRTQHRRQPTADDVATRTTPPQPESAAPAVAPPADRTEAATAPAPSASGWGGTAVLLVPTLGLLGVVAVVVAVNEVNQWWTLVFAMAFVVVATLCVVATIGRMLGGEDD